MGGASAEAFESGRIHKLSHQLRRKDTTVGLAVSDALRAKAPDIQDSTLRRYSEGLDHFAAFVGAGASVRDSLTSETVQSFKAARLSQGASRETVNNDLGAVSILATHALRKGWIVERPTIKRFPSAVRISYLEADQIRLYMASLRKRFRPLFQLLLGTGMRLGEAENLTVHDLRFGPDGTRVLVRDAKTPSGVRPVFAPNWVAAALQDHIEASELAGSDRLFTVPRRTTQKEHSRTCSNRGTEGLHDP